MAKIKIDVQEGGKPSVTITIPLWMARGASKMMTNAGGKNLKDKIDIEQLRDQPAPSLPHSHIYTPRC